MDQSDEECLLLVDERIKAPQGFSWRRPLLGTALAFGAVAAVAAVHGALVPCPAKVHLEGDVLVSLAQVHTTEMSGMLVSQDPDVVKDWLLEASRRQAVGGSEQLKKAQRATSDAIDTKDPEKAKQVVNRVLERSLSGWHAKRQALKSYIKSHRRGLKGLLPPNKGQEASTAECVFNVEQATTQIAALASNIADSAKTCIQGANFLETSGKVCVVNLAGIFYSVSTIAASLSLAAENCASTLMPNYDAMCAGGITGVAASLSQFAGSAALTSAACSPPKHVVPEGATPSNFGQPDGPGAKARRLHEQQNTTAHARRLVFGGGKGSDVTQCVVDASSVAWWLAQAGLAINAAANPKDGESCKMPPILKGKLETYAQSVCAVDVLGAINGFGQAIYYLQMAVTQCRDQLDMEAMCGAGIDGMVSSLVGGGAGGIGIWLNCWEAQGWVLTLKQNKALAIARKVVMTTKVNGLKQEGNYGRRLEAKDEDIEALKERFGSPEQAWKSIGYDMADPNAAFRGVHAEVNPEELVSLVGEQEVKQEDGGLFGGSGVCS